MTFAAPVCEVEPMPTSSPIPPEMTPVIYEPYIGADGLLVRYDTEVVIEELVTKGRQVFIHKKVRYPILYRAFQRFAAKHRKLVAGRRLAMAQVNTDKWAVILRDKKSVSRPIIETEDGFNRKHGRYKKWAMELNEGGVWQSPDPKEVDKVMAAWRLYVPQSSRKNFRLMRRKIGTRWSIFVIPKAG